MLALLIALVPLSAPAHAQALLPPAPPEALVASMGSSGAVQLGWSAPAGEVDGYNIYRDGLLVGTTDATAYVDAGAGDLGHLYLVTAFNSAGEGPPASNAIHDPANCVQSVIPPVVDPNGCLALVFSAVWWVIWLVLGHGEATAGGHPKLPTAKLPPISGLDPVP